VSKCESKTLLCTSTADTTNAINFTHFTTTASRNLAKGEDFRGVDALQCV
jgi:hypothetical protein